jgi:hypothetical protein
MVLGYVEDAADATVDGVAWATDGTIDLVQGGAGATEDIVNDSTHWFADSATEFGMEAGRATVDPLLGFAGLGNWTQYGAEQNQQKQPQKPQGSGLPMDLILIVGVAAIAAFFLLGGD